MSAGQPPKQIRLELLWQETFSKYLDALGPQHSQIRSATEMLYLFNSAYRPLYARNVLNTLFLPPGATNEYRYRFRANQGSTDQVNIAPISFEKLTNYPVGDPITITFIDRFAPGGYVYHPLRLGKFVRTREKGDYLFFRVQLEEFLYPRDKDAFNELVRRSLVPAGIPKLTGNDPYNSGDGYYAVIEESLFTRRTDFYWEEEAWTGIVDQIRHCKAFEGAPTEGSKEGAVKKAAEFVFIRCDVVEGSDRSVRPKLREGQAFFDLVRGTRYQLALSYRYPAQIIDTSASGIVRCELGENLKPLGSKIVHIDSCSNSVYVPFATKRNLEDYVDGVSLAFESEQPNRELIGPDPRLLFRIRESRYFWLQISFALLIFTSLSVFIGADITKISPLTLRNVVETLWPKGLAGLVQAGVLFWLFRLVGKKFL